MNLLLDTHIALWAIGDNPNLPQKAKELIMDPDNSVYFSSVSTWEVMMKHDAPHTNLSLTASEFVEYCEEAGYFQLNMNNKHVVAASLLDASEAENHGHKDPFYRLLLAQAKAENYSFLTHDSKIEWYNEKCVIKV